MSALHVSRRVPDRLFLFADTRLAMSATLIDAALAAARRTPGLVVAAVVETADRPTGWLSSWRARSTVHRALERLFASPSKGGEPRQRALPSLSRIARRHGAYYLAPPARDVNHPEFLAQVSRGEGEALLLSLGCLQRFAAPLLAKSAVAVNFHDAALPTYRGLRATAWSIFCGEPTSGYSFHHMDERLDTGPIVLQESIPLDAESTPRSALRQKVERAARAIDRVLAAMVGREPGRPQVGAESYRGRRELVRLTRVEEPSALAWRDLEARLRAFGLLELQIGGRLWEVSAVRRRRPGERATPGFLTCDGIAVVPHRCLGLPRWLYRLARPWRLAAAPAAQSA